MSSRANTTRKAKTSTTPTFTPEATEATEAAHAPEVVVERGTAAAPTGLTQPAQDRVDAILGMVQQDISNAEVGKFFALRAGVGLIVVKEFCDHGEWASQMLRMLPGRAPRTLRRYMSDARGFLDSRALMAADIWDRLASVGQEQLGRVAGRLLIGEGKGGGEGHSAADWAEVDPLTSDIPEELIIMADYLQETGAPKRGGGAPRTLSAAERRAAATDLWQAIAGRATDEGIAKQSWQMLDAETLETVASALRTVSDKMMQAARKAKAKAADKDA